MHCDRFVWPHLKPECERTVVYVHELREELLGRRTYRRSRYGLALKDFTENHDDAKAVQQILGLNEYVRYAHSGFWEDDRLLDVPCLAPNYQQWLIKRQAQSNGTGL